MVQLFYTTYISVDLAHHEIFRAKVGKGGINPDKAQQNAGLHLEQNFLWQSDDIPDRLFSKVNYEKKKRLQKTPKS